MKKLIPTLVLVLVCVGLFWYASSNNFFKEEEKKPVKLLDVTQENAQSIVVVSASESTEIVRDGDGWKMVKPAVYPLNNSALESWFGYVSGITQDMVVEENAADLAKYGLDKPKTEFRVTLKDGTTHKLRIGDALPVPGYMYAAIDDAGTVYRVGETGVNTAYKTPLDFIDKNPIVFDTDAVTSLRVKWKGGEWKLDKAEKDKSAYDSKWKLGDKELAGSDVSLITSAARFLATDVLPKPAADAGLSGAADLMIEVTITQNGADVTKTYNGKVDGEQVWLAAPDSAWAYAIAQTSVQELFDKGKK